MEVWEERDGEVLILAPDGDISNAEESQGLERRLRGALSSGARGIVVDFSKVGSLGGAAVRAMLSASRKLARSGGRLVLCGLTPKVRQTFSISGFVRDFTVLDTREAAVRTAREPFVPGPKTSEGKTPAASGVPARRPGEAAVSAPSGRASGDKAPSPAAVAPPRPEPARELPSASVGPPAAPQPVIVPAPAPAPDPRSLLADRLVAALRDACPARAAGRASAAREDLRPAADALLHALALHTP